MKKTITTILILNICIIKFSVAQLELTLGPILDYKHLHLYKELGKTENMIYSVWVNTHGAKGNDELFLVRNNFPELTKASINPIPLPDGDGKYPVLEDMYLLKDKIVAFCSFHQVHKKTLFLEVFGLDGNILQPLTELESIGIKTPNNSSFSIYCDTASNVCIVEKTGYANTITHEVSVYNLDEFKLLFNNRFPDNDMQMEITNYSGYSYTKNHLFIYIKSVEVPKGSIIANKDNMRMHEYLVITKDNKNSREISIDDGSSYYSGISYKYLSKENIIVVGGYKVRGGKWFSFLTTIDATTSVIKKNYELEVKVEEEKVRVNSFKTRIGLFIKMIYVMDDAVWVIGEQSLKVLGNDNLNSFYCYDMIVTRFGLKDNTSCWVDFPKREYLKAHPAALGATNLVFEQKGNLCVMYLDSPNNLKILSSPKPDLDKLEKVIEHDNSTLVVGKISPDCKIIRETSNAPEAKDFQLKSRIVPNSTNSVKGTLCSRISSTSYLIFIRGKKVGHWAILSNI